MSRGGGTTLYVTGFGQGTRARDLAYEFERYGRLVRCDIPAPRTASSRLFAFVEYESRRDADDAYHEMHNKRIGRDDLLKIEWARTPPSASWRFDAGASRPSRDGGRRSPRGGGGRGRSATPPRRSTRELSPRGDRDRYDDRRGGDRRDRDRSRSPDDRDRDAKDVRDREDPRDRDDDRERERERETERDVERDAERDAERDERDERDVEPNGTNGDDQKVSRNDSPRGDPSDLPRPHYVPYPRPPSHRRHPNPRFLFPRRPSTIRSIEILPPQDITTNITLSFLPAEADHEIAIVILVLVLPVSALDPRPSARCHPRILTFTPQTSNPMHQINSKAVARHSNIAACFQQTCCVVTSCTALIQASLNLAFMIRGLILRRISTANVRPKSAGIWLDDEMCHLWKLCGMLARSVDGLIFSSFHEVVGSESSTAKHSKYHLQSSCLSTKPGEIHLIFQYFLANHSRVLEPEWRDTKLKSRPLAGLCTRRRDLPDKA
ncbi:hypothetical protein Q7P37_005053 [Cladosporium fusiforme]